MHCEKIFIFPIRLPFNEEIYLCPETHETRDIRLYKCEEFPLKWSFYKTLISDISAADSNIFFKDGRWWLVTNVCSSDSMIILMNYMFFIVMIY